MKLQHSRKIFEKPSISNFMKIRPVGAKLSHAEDRERYDEGDSRFSHLANAPENIEYNLQATFLFADAEKPLNKSTAIKLGKEYMNAIL